MVTSKTDGFKVLATWNHQGMIVDRRSRDPPQFVELDTVSDHPRTLNRKGSASRAKKTMTADERKAARNRWQNS